MRTNRRWPLSAIVISAILAGTASAQEPKELHEKHDTTALYRSLGEVITFGVELFNDRKDYVGCYRVFQGSLLAVRPFLADDLQRKIDKGLAAAEKEPEFADRAHALRGVLDDLRRQLKPAAAKVGEKTEDKKAPKIPAEKKSAEKKDQEKKGEEKKGEEKKSTTAIAGDGQLSGKVTFQNKAVTGGYEITLVRGDQRLKTALQKDGSFHFKSAIAPGDYAVAVDPIPGVAFAVALPPRYEDEKTSGLRITVQGGRQHVDLNLVK